MATEVERINRGRYVRWAQMWHGTNAGLRTYCNKSIPVKAQRTNNQPSRVFACARCFDV